MTAKGTLPTPLPMDQRKRARELWEAGESYGAIECELGIKISSLKSWRKRDGWTRTKPDVAIAPATSPELVDVPDDLPSQQEEYESNMRRAAVAMSRKVATMPAEEIVQKADRIKSADQTSRRALRIESEKPFSVIQIGILAAPIRPAKKDDGRLRSSHNPTVLLEAESAD
jgi:hypothetical protein